MSHNHDRGGGDGSGLTGDGLALYTLDEAARLLGIHHQTLRRHIDAGRIGWVDIGGGDKYRHRRIRADQLAAFIDAHTVDPTPATG